METQGKRQWPLQCCQPQRFLCGGGEIYANAHPDGPKREALSCLQYSGLNLTWKRATRAVSPLGIQRGLTRYSFTRPSISVNCILVRPIKQRGPRPVRRAGPDPPGGCVEFARCPEEKVMSSLFCGELPRLDEVAFWPGQMIFWTRSKNSVSKLLWYLLSRYCSCQSTKCVPHSCLHGRSVSFSRIYVAVFHFKKIKIKMPAEFIINWSRELLDQRSCISEFCIFGPSFWFSRSQLFRFYSPFSSVKRR